MSEQDSCYRVVLPDGRTVDIMTQEGADAFLQHHRGNVQQQQHQHQHQQGFIAANMPAVRQLRQILSHGNSAQRKEAAEGLLAIYNFFGSVADRASHDVFDSQVGTSELKEFLEHSMDVLEQISDSVVWERTGILRYDYDSELLDTIATLCMHEKFVKLHEEMGLMPLLAGMCSKRQQPRLVSPDYADCVLKITNNTSLSHERRSSRPLTTEKSYSKIEATGLLLQALRVISLPSRSDYHSQMVILDKLQSSPKLLRKTFCSGTPIRNVIDDVLACRNGYPSAVPSLVRQRLINICEIADLASRPLQPHGRDIRLCRNCNKTGADLGLDEKLFACSKCNNTYYCSRACQVADWKSHKKLCGVGVKVSKTHEQTLSSYVQRYYYEILTALWEKMQESNVAKTELIVDLDFHNSIGSDKSTSPALRGEFKVAITKDYLSGRDAPAWFRDHSDEELQRDILAAIKDYYKRELRSHILVLCRHPGGGAGVFRLQHIDPGTSKPLFADEVVTAFGNGDWDTLGQYLDRDMIISIRQRTSHRLHDFCKIVALLMAAVVAIIFDRALFLPNRR